MVSFSEIQFENALVKLQYQAWFSGISGNPVGSKVGSFCANPSATNQRRIVLLVAGKKPTCDRISFGRRLADCCGWETIHQTANGFLQVERSPAEAISV
jgi:hypothetical protein